MTKARNIMTKAQIYHFRNRICPICHKLLSPYSYSIKGNKKIHIECIKDGKQNEGNNR